MKLDTWKIVIGWGEPNLDLDAYLKLPEGDYSLAEDKRECKNPERRVISYDCKKLFYRSAVASLDLDNRTAYGIETITGISDLISVIYLIT